MLKSNYLFYMQIASVNNVGSSTEDVSQQFWKNLWKARGRLRLKYFFGISSIVLSLIRIA